MVGLALLALNAELRLNFGDIYTLLCAIALSFHIVLIGYYVSNIDPVALATFQIGIVAALGVICGLVFEVMPTSFEHDMYVAMAITSIPGTALGFLIQNTMQRYVTTTRTAIIFLLEPVFAWIGAYFMLGEILTQKQMVGCMLIIAGILISELRVFEKKKVFKEA
ncbi:DMT family transporter [Pelosinus sp. Bkl1]|uniref:DMT family transporter n=2 Tax=Pelosinus baikalensis TaxID=2892015 RepID=A0ABS8HQD1_9FIRM|nr:DMT family transporter [Pelosinus baikalensis]